LAVTRARRGFPAALTPEELCCCSPAVVRGDFRTTRHLMYEATVSEDGGPPRTFLGLNEIAVQTGPPFHMIELDLLLDDVAVASYAGDGLIISTPIGSTGHGPAGGGPGPPPGPGGGVGAPPRPPARSPPPR